MKYDELRWIHLASVLERVSRGAAMNQAARDAGLSTKLWAKARTLWDELPEHLAKVDPAGLPIDLARLNDLIRANLRNGGRPQGSKDQVRRTKADKTAMQPTLIVKDSSFYIEDGMFFVYDD